jgi:hypothetical protein
MSRNVESNSLWTTPLKIWLLDLLEWLGRNERTYQETMGAWRTSCPRLPVWEDANDRGLVEATPANGDSLVRLTPAGHALLKEKRPHSYAELDGSLAAVPRREGITPG